jgi:hypothetical protein
MARKALIGNYYPSAQPGGNDPRQLHKNIQTDVKTCYDLANAPEYNTVSVTNFYQVQPDDRLIFCGGSAAYTVLLPTPIRANGKAFRLRNTQGVSTVTIATVAGKIDGATTVSLAAGELRGDRV